ncbi:hypothetical protein VTN02DRAFT_6511 [Thermoascus thermophilus]
MASLGILFSLGLLSIIGIMAAWLLMVTCFRRKLYLQSEHGPEQSRIFLGKPLLFPTRLSHMRMARERYSYWHSYFNVGIPVGLRGRVGTVLSIDMDRTDAYGSGKGASCLPVRRPFMCWFNIDPAYYLDRGNNHLGLEGKLHVFLQSIGEDPKQWPYAYLVGIPQFLWWTKSPISYWYLYSPSKELDAMIMEINNSYGEKKNAFFRLSGDGPHAQKGHMSATIDTVKTETSAEIRFVSSSSQSEFYKGSWEKDIFASPFEKVEGSISARFADPLKPAPCAQLHSNATAILPSGKPTIASRLYSWGEPLDPLSASSWELAKFLLGWTPMIPISLARIVQEAIRVRLRGNLPYLKKPETRRGNISREATDIERDLEPFFRHYLSHLASHCPYPLTVNYKPSSSHHLQPASFHSPVPPSASSPARILTIQPLTPAVYTSILQYSDATSGFASEMRVSPVVTDALSQRLWVSDPSLLQELLAAAAPSLVPEERQPPRPWLSALSRIPLSWLRRSSDPTFMDTFVDAHLPTEMQRTYRRALCRHHLAERCAFGSHRLLSVYGLIARFVLVCMIVRVMTSILWTPARSWLENMVVVPGASYLVAWGCFRMVRCCL